MQLPRKWCGSTLLLLVSTFALRGWAHGGRRVFLESDVHLDLVQNPVTPAPHNLMLYQQQLVTSTTNLGLYTTLTFTTTNIFQTTTNMGQAAAVVAQVEGAVMATQAAAAQAAAAQAGAAMMATTTMLPQAAVSAAVGAPAAAIPVGGAPALAAVATVAPLEPVDAGISIPDIPAADMLPVTAEANPEAAEQMMRAAQQNAAPAGPEAKVIADWAERFGKYSMDATVKAMRDVVSQIAREKAEEVIRNVFDKKYPNLHVHGLLPPMPAPAPGPAPMGLAPAVPAGSVP